MTVTIDSRLYRASFYGILNANGAFWTPLAFDSEAAAEAHLERFWTPDKWQGLRSKFKIVPVRIQLTALPCDSRLKERWRAIPGYEGRYEVSDLGRVRSLARTEITVSRGRPCRRSVKGGILTPSLRGHDGYLHVSLRKSGKLKMAKVHQLVCRAFCGEANALHREVAHLDGTRTNNRADNLRWVSHRENILQRHAHGTDSAGSRHPRSKLTEAEVREIRALPHKYARKVGERYGVAATTIYDLWKGRRWRHLDPKDESGGAGTAIAHNQSGPKDTSYEKG